MTHCLPEAFESNEFKWSLLPTDTHLAIVIVVLRIRCQPTDNVACVTVIPTLSSVAEV
jgi:hypothetical protein